MVNKVVGNGTFDAEVDIVERFAGSRTGDLHHPLIRDMQIQLAADATEIARRSHFVGSNLDQILRCFLFDQGAGGTGVDATAAQLAGRIDQTALTSGRDRGLAAATGKRDRIDGFDFITVCLLYTSPSPRDRG